MIYFVIGFIIAIKFFTFPKDPNIIKSKQTKNKTIDTTVKQDGKKKYTLNYICGEILFTVFITTVIGAVLWVFLGSIVTATFVKTEEVVMAEYKLVSLDNKSIEQNGKYLNTYRRGNKLKVSYATNTVDGIQFYTNTVSNDYDFYVFEDNSVEPNIKKYGNRIIDKHWYDYIIFTNILFDGSYYTKTVITVPTGNLSNI